MNKKELGMAKKEGRRKERVLVRKRFISSQISLTRRTHSAQAKICLFTVFPEEGIYTYLDYKYLHVDTLRSYDKKGNSSYQLP